MSFYPLTKEIATINAHIFSMVHPLLTSQMNIGEREGGEREGGREFCLQQWLKVKLLGDRPSYQ